MSRPSVSASEVLAATARSAPAAPGLPPWARWSGLVAAALVGAVLGTGTGTVARVRRDRPMHAVGRTYRVTLEPLRDAEPSGALWLDTLGPREGLLRFSRGAGLPTWAPDVQGAALRLPERRGHTDLLFSSTGMRGPARFALVPRRSALAGPAGTLMPFRGPDGPLLLALEPVRADRTRTATTAEHPRAPDDAAGLPDSSAGLAAEEFADRHAEAAAPSPTGTRWRLLWSGLSGPWHPVAELVVGPEAGPDVDASTRFDPLGATPPGLPSYRWAAALRSPSYRFSQLLGRHHRARRRRTA